MVSPFGSRPVELKNNTICNIGRIIENKTPLYKQILDATHTSFVPSANNRLSCQLPGVAYELESILHEEGLAPLLHTALQQLVVLKYGFPFIFPNFEGRLDSITTLRLSGIYGDSNFMFQKYIIGQILR